MAITGLNIDSAQQTIKGFRFAGLVACGDLCSCISDMFSELSVAWYSPNAVKFEKENTEKLETKIFY